MYRFLFLFTCHHLMSCDLTWCHVTSPGVMWSHPDVMWSHLMSCDLTLMSCDLTWCHVTFTWCHVTSTPTHQDLETTIVTKIQQQTYEITQAVYTVSTWLTYNHFIWNTDPSPLSLPSTFLPSLLPSLLTETSKRFYECLRLLPQQIQRSSASEQIRSREGKVTWPQRARCSV